MSPSGDNTGINIHDLESEADPGLPLIPDDFGEDELDFKFDHVGATRYRRLQEPSVYERARPGPVTRVPLNRPCSLGALNGSWNITIRPKTGFLAGQLRGPMRLEAADGELRV